MKKPKHGLENNGWDGKIGKYMDPTNGKAGRP